MKKLVLSLWFFLSAACLSSRAQDTLPRFSAKNLGNNRIVISWTNTFESIRQISIQRSFDSLQGYKTILTVADPTTPQNGFVDAKASTDHMFYRLYIMLDKGIFLFSEAKRPVVDTVRKSGLAYNYNPITGQTTVVSTDKTGGADSAIGPETGVGTRDRSNVFVASKHVYTYKDGYVRVELPVSGDKKYSIKFFEEDDSFLFEMKNIKERDFKLDKTNFYHAGWFKFELYENGVLVEKHKFYLGKDF